MTSLTLREEEEDEERAIGVQSPTISEVSATPSMFTAPPAILSPACPVCGCEPKTTPPIQNIALGQLMYLLRKSRHQSEMFEHFAENKMEKARSPTPSSASSGFEETEEVHESTTIKAPIPDAYKETSIRKCNVVIFGGAKVGKTQLARTQYLNNLFFGEIDEDEGESRSADGSPKAESREFMRAKYMLSIIDNNNVKEDLKDAHGVVLVYAVDDHKSFEKIQQILQEIQLRLKRDPPIVIVATKCDLEPSKTKVKASEGQKLAQAVGCPFIEVSSRNNERVNEVFAQLVQIVDHRLPTSA
jgi:GTPase SAR1 family protein